MKERDFYRPVQNWLKENIKETAVVELKLVKEGRFRVSDLRPHQIQSLLHCKNSAMIYKIPDAGYDQKPFDICLWNRTLAYVGVIFYEPRKKKTMYLIDIEVLLNDGTTSFTESMLSQICQHQVEIGH